MKNSSVIAYVLGAFFVLGVIATPSGGDNPVFLRSAIFIVSGLITLSWAVKFYLDKAQRTRLNISFFSFAIIFVLFLSISSVLSDAQPVISIFGWLGRADGLLAWIGVVAMFLAASALNRNGRKILLNYLFLGSGLALLVSMAQISGFTPVPTAGYLGAASTFGNPNFAGAFFGFIAVASFWMIFDSKQIWLKATYSLLATGSAVAAWQSQSLQGPAVLLSVLAVSFVLFLQFTPGRKRVFAVATSYILILVGGVITFLTIQGSGPLGFLADETTIKIRQIYWETGLNIAKNHSLFGVGPDSFQRFNGANRSDLYIETVGSEIIVSAAHNIPLQVASTLGVPAALVWSLLLIGPAILFVFLLSTNKLEVVDKFVALATLSILSGYLIQSMVSIDQITLKATGWLAAGLIVSIIRDSRQRPTGVEPSKRRPAVNLSNQPAWPGFSAVILLVSVLGLSVFHYQSISPGTFTADRAKEMLTSQWVPCQMKFRILQALEQQESLDIKNLSFMKSVVEVDDRCYETVAFLISQALNTTAALGSPALAEAKAAVLDYSALLIEIDPKSWKNQIFRAEGFRVNEDLASARVAFAEAERLARLQPGTLDQPDFEIVRNLLYPTN
jgi:O-antigen ligase